MTQFDKMNKKFGFGRTILITTIILSAILFIGGFLAPPLGVIDGSVLTAVGELIGICALAQATSMIKHGKDVTFKHGNTTLSVGDNDNTSITKEEENENI